MAELQTERSFVVELTPEGVQEIQSHKKSHRGHKAHSPVRPRVVHQELHNPLDRYPGFHSRVYYGQRPAVRRPNLVSGAVHLRAGPHAGPHPLHPAGKVRLPLRRQFSRPVQDGIRTQGHGHSHHHPCLHGLPVVRDSELDRRHSSGRHHHRHLPGLHRSGVPQLPRSLGLFVLINFYIGYHGSRAIRFLEGFRRPHPDHSQRRSHCLGLLAGQVRREDLPHCSPLRWQAAMARASGLSSSPP